MPITLQSTVGGFDAAFRRRLPLLERAIVDHGLDPAEFVFSKDFATPATLPFVGPCFYDYTVFVGDEHFTVTEPNDSRFLDYFHKRVIAAEADAPEEPRRSDGWMSRLSRWMSQPI